ncbi:hypothetical protein FPSE_07895 [Fusarium pseudograminearum CS3096]|uniref:Uncharacterized protein n=1 Tax=Fusarium pseudograminearum (strain CS3096) TaxID=1028729 RepID=K3VD39_FUSPC|nr:hypothetical protein FPSE_07895 [Fusarium pseudograminearum CS3096]EKJ71892.1 hypothetical protein FPSE_07895 [Fusarium pseudograminearum CS3096]KAF0636111.1 hypothetical protein FPSE5266_07895 [Fusarium pseudograminearum]
MNQDFSGHSNSNQNDINEVEEAAERRAASDLPSPESVEGYDDLPRYPPGSPVPKGYGGALIRTLKGIPPCVWIINQHDEDITVVVSKYRPNRLLSGAEVNASATGGGLNFSSTTYLGPATTKTLVPETESREGSVGVFPLWTRKNGFGVVTIFKGSDKYIENDRIEAGATGYFIDTPNLKIVSFKEALSDKS